MKPNPLASLNHFTVPVIRAMEPILPLPGLTVKPIPLEQVVAVVGAPNPT
jgi:hypothetical protein